MIFGFKKRKIQNLDLAIVGVTLKKRTGWSDERVAAAEVEYRKFLYMILMNPDEEFAPWSAELDLFWHEHILHTMKYAEDCDNIFGKIIHHSPWPKEGEDEKRIQANTMLAYDRSFTPANSVIVSSNYGASGIQSSHSSDSNWLIPAVIGYEIGSASHSHAVETKDEKPSDSSSSSSWFDTHPSTESHSTHDSSSSSGSGCSSSSSDSSSSSSGSSCSSSSSSSCSSSSSSCSSGSSSSCSSGS